MQGRPIIDVVHPAFPQPTTVNPAFTYDESYLVSVFCVSSVVGKGNRRLPTLGTFQSQVKVAFIVQHKWHCTSGENLEGGGGGQSKI